jgi:hypothetical protein
VRYRAPPADFVYSKPTLVEFRRPFLEQRVDEIVEAMRHVLSPSAGGALAGVLATVVRGSSTRIEGVPLTPGSAATHAVG